MFLNQNYVVCKFSKWWNPAERNTRSYFFGVFNVNFKQVNLWSLCNFRIAKIDLKIQFNGFLFYRKIVFINMLWRSYYCLYLAVKIHSLFHLLFKFCSSRRVCAYLFGRSLALSWYFSDESREIEDPQVSFMLSCRCSI